MICNYWKFQLTNKRAPVKQLSWCLWAALTFILNSRPSFIWICILPEPSLFCLKSMVPFGPVDCRSTSSYSYESAAASCWRSCKKEEGEAKQTCKRCLKKAPYSLIVQSEADQRGTASSSRYCDSQLYLINVWTLRQRLLKCHLSSAVTI